MTRKLWETWGVAIMAGLLTGVPLMYVGAYVTGTPIKHPLTLNWLASGVHHPVPMWFATLVITLAATMTTLFIREWGERRTSATKYKSVVADLKELEGRLLASQALLSNATFISSQPDLRVLGSAETSISYLMSKSGEKMKEALMLLSLLF